MSAASEPIEVPGQPWALYTGIALGIALVFGLVTWALGLGPFAYRQILYGTSQVYILNMTEGPVEVTLDKGRPVVVAPESAERTPILGGTTHLVATKSGELIEEVDAFVDGHPLVYNVGGAQCLVLSDVSSFYLGSANPAVEVKAVFGVGTKLIPLPHTRVIWPRETLRDQVQGASEGVAWLEIVGCSLIEPQERQVLESHLNVLLTERKRVEVERKAAEKIRRAMMRGGGEAVDEVVEKKGGGATFKVRGADAGQ